MNEHTFTIGIVIAYTINATIYAYHGDWGRVSYWTCAAGITISATWGIGH